MRATFQLLTAYFAATSVREPARLVLQHPFAAHARFFHQERAFRAGFFIAMAIVRNPRVTTTLGALAFEPTRWWLRSAREWRLENSPSAVTTDFIEDGFSAAATGSFMAQFSATVRSTFQQATAKPGADVFCFDFDVQQPRSAKWAKLAFRSLPFSGFPFSRTASFPTLMSTTVESSFACSHALRPFFAALVTYCGRLYTATPT